MTGPVMTKRSHLRKWLMAVAGLAIAYFAFAYVIMPRVWFDREHEPGLQTKPAVTATPDGIPGDPLNVGLVGEKGDVILALHAAGWYPADAITLKSSIEIAGSVVFDRPYDEAPVSTLIYEGRKQDLAFEKPIGDSADRRNHVRFWKVLDKGLEGRPVWLGSATLDQSVGLNAYTGQFTHHIAPDIDDERNRLIADLTSAKTVTSIYQVTGIGPTIAGRNGEGDAYRTDGEIRIAVLSPGAAPVTGAPEIMTAAPLIAWKDGMWRTVSDWIGP
jgi:hypothetical protein